VAETVVETLICYVFQRCAKCISVGGGYVEKCFFISHVLRFVSICDLFTDSPSYAFHRTRSSRGTLEMAFLTQSILA
jgi:hypothetical protein